MQQIQEKVKNKQKKKREVENSAKKTIEKTSFGPEQSPERINLEKTKAEEIKKVLKEGITDQMIVKPT